MRRLEVGRHRRLEIVVAVVGVRPARLLGVRVHVDGDDRVEVDGHALGLRRTRAGHLAQEAQQGRALAAAKGSGRARVAGADIGKGAGDKGAPRPRQAQFDRAPVARRDEPLDQPVAHEEANDLRHVRAFDAERARESALPNAGVLADRDQNADLARPDAACAELIEEGFKDLKLREPQHEARKLGQRTEIDGGLDPFERAADCGLGERGWLNAAIHVAHSLFPATARRAARFSIKAFSRSAASGLVAVNDAMIDSTKRPSSCAMSWMRGRALMIA